MPLGFQRLNERTHRPNENINFIKPLPTSSEQDQMIAKDFLERIAAQCYPVMNKEYISVMALEEYPPNAEFLGRNFNAGEVIQLVLKDKAGRWLSFKFVQMVMMHELAHCKQMNHSRSFWQVRNKFAETMQSLWAQKYTGEGLWGRGQDLESGVFTHDHMPDNKDIPENLCGGTYRRRGKKRKRGTDGEAPTKISYAERQQRRIAKKFGKHGDGHDLGEDELVRGALERGKRHYSKPKVANSKRGRELRANAALARFEAAKNHTTTPELQEDDESDTDSESDDEYGDSLPILKNLGEVADQDGHHFFKIDEQGEDERGEDAQDELKELQLLVSEVSGTTNGNRNRSAADNRASQNGKTRLHEDSDTESELEEEILLEIERVSTTKDTETAEKAHISTIVSAEDTDQTGSWTFAPINSSQSKDDKFGGPTASKPSTCPVCTLENDPNSPTCVACAHVLRPKLMSNSWRCKNEACKGSNYINSSDAGRCGLCGSLKPPADSRPMGVMNAGVLRWD